ncbi:uncharacterized protein LOC125377488 [Haliotis rufescens]|uniref:uncharacterized protein LOC125377488 n=1 Tax=Haliotis rufescens TaxID=6454 RepID=UPI00201F2B42|nr:uncharacterized protein LOC125377488 [Haliotis rufescens]
MPLSARSRKRSSQAPNNTVGDVDLCQDELAGASSSKRPTNRQRWSGRAEMTEHLEERTNTLAINDINIGQASSSKIPTNRQRRSGRAEMTEHPEERTNTLAINDINIGQGEAVLNPFAFNSINQTEMQKFKSTSIPLGFGVGDKLKAKIWQNEFIEISSLLSGDTHDQNLTINVNGQSVNVSDSSKKMFLSIDKWVSAFHIFMSVHIQKYPEDVQVMLKYVSTIRELAQKGGNWYAYDTKFRKLRSENNLDWGTVHWELWFSAITSNLQNFRPSNQKQFKAKTSGSAKSAIPNGFCFSFHLGRECNAKPCRYSHYCSQCGGDHGYSKCGQRKEFGRPNRANQPPNPYKRA